YQYTKLNGIPPAHTDLQKYFEVTPPSVNQMINTLEKKGSLVRNPVKLEVFHCYFRANSYPF
ncbi:hypothetical protein, partial [Shewanella surugensis]|nr:hypothetical protein [Shewanella surugensis]